MLGSRYITVITVAAVCLALLGSASIVYAAHAYDTARAPEYQEKLFGEDVLSIDIQVDESDWQYLLDNAANKEYIPGTLVINGEAFAAVGIRTKGNSSLTQVVSSDSDRYSLEFKFDHYVKGQTCYGLDNFCVNNLHADATYMKDAIAYDIMTYIGVPSPLTNYASITVNGGDWGFYLAMERYDESFLDRVYGTVSGQLYNVKIQMGQRTNFAEGNMEMGNGVMGGFPGSQSGGGSLVYNGDDISGYGAIFDNAVSAKVSDKEQQRVVTAIKHLSEGAALEQYWDVDEILRYFAAHTVLVNLDSYVSNMQQNYYIYERDGKLSILPWDYNLSFGGFQSGSATSVVNFPIDTPVSGVNMEDRPLLNQLLEVEEYKERYHGYLRDIVEGYFESGRFEYAVQSLDEKINAYVRNDASAFFTYEQYEAALPVLAELGTLRAQSVAGQLSGDIPSTTAGQTADNSTLVDASHISLSAMGSMGGGRDGGGGDVPFGQDGGFQPDGMDMSGMREAMEILRSADGALTDEQLTALGALGLSGEEIAQFKAMAGGMPGQGDAMQGGFRQGGGPPDEEAADGAARPGGPPAGFQDINMSSANTISQGYAVALILSLLLLAGGILFMARRRRSY